MRTKSTTYGFVAGAVAALAVLAAGSATVRSDAPAPATTTVSLCDGESTMQLPVAPGTALPEEQARGAAAKMMDQWRATQGEVRWASWVAERDAAEAAQAPAAPAAAPAAQPDQPEKWSARDKMLWKRELDRTIAEGYKLYHSPTALGGTIGVSCDMCHPDGSNTHPETYPKFQVQLKKVALLRDMINWCIENPEKGKPLPDDDPRMKAVEAYILSTRKGVGIEPGKH